MSAVAATQRDFFDNVTSFFTDNSREFFKTCHQFFFWNKYFTGKETKAIANGISTFSTLFDSFNVIDMMSNFNDVRNHLLGKSVKDASLLASDTVNSICESVTWLKGPCGILSLGAYASSWVTSVSGITLMYSCAKRTFQEIKDLKTLWNISKNVALFALGVLLFTNGWLGWALNLNIITLFSAITIISSFATHLIKNIRTGDC